MILPLVKWLKDRGVDFQYGIDVKNVLFDINNGRKVAKPLKSNVMETKKTSHWKKMIW